jgi:hypothetical protein
MHVERDNRLSSNLVRLSGLAAMLGGLLGVILTPILPHLWATYSDTYLYYGRAYFLVYVGCLLGLTGLYAQRTRSRLKAESWGFAIELGNYPFTVEERGGLRRRNKRRSETTCQIMVS